MELPFITALTIGLIGSTHCIGMCGGIVGALNAGLPQSGRSPLSRIGHHLSYNAGRIASYVMAGAVAGFAGSLIAEATLGSVAPIGRLIAGILMILLGFYLAGWWHAITVLEKLGLHLWKRIQPFGSRFLPVETPSRAFGLGLVWGWLPCGLVYSALALAIVAASPGQGALIMLGFGLGTLPALLAMGGVAEHVMALVRKPALRQIAGASVILFGLYTCFTAFGGHNHHHAAVDHSTMNHDMGAPSVQRQ